jgi:hypothetical protein
LSNIAVNNENILSMILINCDLFQMGIKLSTFGSKLEGEWMKFHYNKEQYCGITGPTLTTKYFISRKYVYVFVILT